MQKTVKVAWTLRYGRAPISQRDGITSANRKRRFECRRPERYQEFPGVGVRSIKGFNDHPACVFGLSFTMHNSAEPIQIESGDVVLALPFKVNAQSTCGGFAVYAHRDCCISESFHTSRSFRLFLLEFLFVYRRRTAISYSSVFIRPSRGLELILGFHSPGNKIRIRLLPPLVGGAASCSFSPNSEHEMIRRLRRFDWFRAIRSLSLWDACLRIGSRAHLFESV
jgi:hypothetical protein